MPPEEFMMSPEMSGAAVAGMMAIQLVIFAVIYVYMAICFQIIAKKTATANPWMAWVPIANFILMLNIAKKPVWWIILLLIPLVNLVILIILFMEIAKARGKPGWVGILMLVPIVNLILPAYLAFSK